MRLTLRTLLAYLDDTLEPAQATAIGQKLAESPEALALVERIRRVTRRRGLSTPPSTGTGTPSDPNTVAGYLSDSLPPEQLREFEETCIESDTHLAEVAACHQILTLLLSEQIRVPPTAYKRMYRLVKGRESIPGRRPGSAIPVGGVIETPVGDDDSDAPFLLGMSDGGKGGRNSVLRWGMAAALVAGFVAAAILVWPKGPAERKGGELARNPNDPLLRPVDPKPPVVPPAPVPNPGPPIEPGDVPPMPMPPPLLPDDPMPVEPMMPVVEPKRDPLLELVPAKTPPRAGRVPGPDLDPTSPPVVVTKAGETAWTAATGEKVRVFTSDRAVALPGFKVKLNVDGGQMTLWGNMPEVQPIASLLEAAVTPHDPYQGFAADFTLHVGRVYLTANRAAGAKFRVRLLDEIWDVTVADKSEVVVEVLHQAAPAADEPARTFAALHVNTGTAAVRSRHKEVPKLVTGEELTWTSFGEGLVGPQKPPPESKRRNSAYYARTGIAPNADAAKAMLTAVDTAAKRVATAATVTGAVDELFQDDTGGPAAPCLAAYAAGALGQYGKVADALNDPSRFLVRMAGRQAARQALALPGGAEFFKAAAKKLRVEKDKDGEQLLSAGLRGLTDPQKKSEAVIDLLVKKLEADEVAIRDLAFELLAFQVDPAAQKNKALFPFDAGARAEVRAPVVAAWQKRAEELKRMIGM